MNALMAFPALIRGELETLELIGHYGFNSTPLTNQRYECLNGIPRPYQGGIGNLVSIEKCLFIFQVYHSFPIIWVRKPELVREKCAVPNKNVIQGMDLVYSQTKSGRPEGEVLHIGKLIP